MRQALLNKPKFSNRKITARVDFKPWMGYRQKNDAFDQSRREPS